MDYVKSKSFTLAHGILALLVAIMMIAAACSLSGCLGSPSDEDAIRAKLTSELDSIKNLDDSFVDEFSESINMSQLSVYGIDGVAFMKSYLDGFDYAIDSITVDGDRATAQITITCKSYTGYQGALQNAVTDITANPDEIAALSMRSTSASARSSSALSTAWNWRPPSRSPSPTPRWTASGSRHRRHPGTSRQRS